MSVIYTYRLGATYQTTGGTAILYTAETGQHVIVRDIVVVNYAAAGALLVVYVLTGGLVVHLVGSSDLAPFTPTHWDGRQVLQPGDQLVANSNAAGWAAIATGYIFET